MESLVRIIQAALRACRLDPENPDKIANITIPRFEGNNDRLIGNVIKAMSYEDPMILEKISVNRMAESVTVIGKNPQSYVLEIDEKCKEIKENIILYVRSSNIPLSYEKAKKSLETQKIKSKEDYMNFYEKNTRLPSDPEKHYNDEWKGWIDFLNLNTSNYYDINTCKNTITSILAKSPEILKQYKNHDIDKVATLLHEQDNKIPSSCIWVEYYNISKMSDMISPPKIKKRSSIL